MPELNGKEYQPARNEAKRGEQAGVVSIFIYKFDKEVVNTFTLVKKDKEEIIGQYHVGWSDERIGEMLNVKPATVKSALRDHYGVPIYVCPKPTSKSKLSRIETRLEALEDRVTHLEHKELQRVETLDPNPSHPPKETSGYGY